MRQGLQEWRRWVGEALLLMIVLRRLLVFLLARRTRARRLLGGSSLRIQGRFVPIPHVSSASDGEWR